LDLGIDGTGERSGVQKRKDWTRLCGLELSPLETTKKRGVRWGWCRTYRILISDILGYLWNLVRFVRFCKKNKSKSSDFYKI